MKDESNPPLQGTTDRGLPIIVGKGHYVPTSDDFLETGWQTRIWPNSEDISFRSNTGRIGASVYDGKAGWIDHEAPRSVDDNEHFDLIELVFYDRDSCLEWLKHKVIQ